MLLLARSDAELTGCLPVDLADVITHVVAQTAGEAGITVHADPGEAVTTGDALLLERLVHNLVENGIRHNEIPGLFEPFRRLAPDRPITAKGAGLGLSIVRSIALAHGGQVMVEPHKGGGLVVTVSLPG